MPDAACGRGFCYHRFVLWTLWRHLTATTLAPFALLWVALTAALCLLVALRVGEVAPAQAFGWSDLAPLLAYSLPHLCVLTIPVTFLGGLLVAYGQLSADGGYLAARAAGIGPLRLAVPAVALGLLVTGASFALTLWAEPAGNARLRRSVLELAKVGAVTGLKPGVFHVALGDLTIYVGDRDGSGALREVLVFDRREPKRTLTAFARKGRLLADAQGSRLYAALEGGELQRLHAGGRVFQRVTFDRYRFDLDLAEILERKVQLFGAFDDFEVDRLRRGIEIMRSEGVSTWRYELLLHRKFSLPVGALAFALLGVGLGLGRVRAPRLRAAVAAGAMVAAYYALLRAADGLAARGQMPVEAAAWLPNLVLLPLGMALLWRHTRRAA